MATFDEAVDREWARAGWDLDAGAELTVEWGVWFSGPTDFHVSIYGSGETDEVSARSFVGGYVGHAGWTARVVARRVLYGAWGERDAD